MVDVKAAVVPAVGADFEIRTVTLDAPGPGEVAIDVAAVGICHTDLAIRDGHLPFPLPGVLGHEGSGTVTAVGAGVTSVQVGDRVKKGQVLARIADDTVASEQAEAKAAVAELEASAAEAKANAERASDLREKGFYSAQLNTQYQTALHTAQARLAAGHAAIERALDIGLAALCAEAVGIMKATLDATVDYLRTRQQFGQPIGAFQAIKHQLANCAVAIEFARPVLWRAASALADGLASAPVHVSHAKLAAGDAAILTAETAHQVHGAMGYTYEVDLHFWMKRAWAVQGYWGSRAFHYNRVEYAILGGSHPIGADASFA